MNSCLLQFTYFTEFKQRWPPPLVPIFGHLYCKFQADIIVATNLKQGATLHRKWGFGWRTIARWKKNWKTMANNSAVGQKIRLFLPLRSSHFSYPTIAYCQAILQLSHHWTQLLPTKSHWSLTEFAKKLRGQKDFLRVVKMKCSVSNNWGASSKLKWTQSNWAACAHSVSAHLQLPFGDPGLMRPPSGDLGLIICLPDRL